MTKSGTGTWDGDVGRRDARTWDAGTRGRGTQGREDVGLGDVGLGDVGLGDVGLGDVGLGDLGLWDVRLWDAGTWDLGTLGDSRTWDVWTRRRDKQTAPEFCAGFLIHNFRWSRGRYYMLESSSANQ